MKCIRTTISDNRGNHLLVALDFCDDFYKQQALQIHEEFSNIDIIDISIEKVYLNKPIGVSVFFKLSEWLLNEFSSLPNAIFTYICSTDELSSNHNEILPQEYRWKLFDVLSNRINSKLNMNIQDVIVGPDGYQTFGRAFYRDKHSPIIHIIASHLQEKQNQY